MITPNHRRNTQARAGINVRGLGVFSGIP
jgi:hypothetical protein